MAPALPVFEAWRLEATGSPGVVTGRHLELTRHSGSKRGRERAPLASHCPRAHAGGQDHWAFPNTCWLPVRDPLPTGVAHSSCPETALSFLPGVQLPGTLPKAKAFFCDRVLFSVRRENKAVPETGEGVK